MYIVFIICPSPSILKYTNKTGRAYFIILLSQFLFFVFFFSFFFHLEKKRKETNWSPCPRTVVSFLFFCYRCALLCYCLFIHVENIPGGHRTATEKTDNIVIARRVLKLTKESNDIKWLKFVCFDRFHNHVHINNIAITKLYTGLPVLTAGERRSNQRYPINLSLVRIGRCPRI
jgi:hypothetical protein